MKKNKLAGNFAFCCAAVCAVFCAGIFCACAEKEYTARSEFSFNTLCTINLYESASDELYARLFGRLRELENVFNNYSPSSEISMMNQRAASESVPLSDDLYTVLKAALEFSRLTDGAFDATVGPLIKLWNFTGENPSVPSDEDFARVLPLVGYQNVVLSDDKTVHFEREGVQIDLGAIAKGYAADEMVKILMEEKVRRAVVSLGGNVYVYGKKGGGERWSVGIRDPFGDGSGAMVLQVENTSVVTSGGYERFFVQVGKRYSHIVSPVTGFPAETDLVSATIICPNSMVADALSTSVFICGMDKIAEFRQSPICGDFDCVLIKYDGTVYATRALKGFLDAILPQSGEGAATSGGEIVYF